MSAAASAPDCLVSAWEAHWRELGAWLRSSSGQREVAEDLLQDVFVKAMRQGPQFCSVGNARAWLFEVARNTLHDHFRRRHQSVELDDQLPEPDEEGLSPIDRLVSCLPRVLGELSEADREVISLCDLQGMSQQDYALLAGLTLPAAKSRILRARRRLKDQLTRQCQVRLDELGRVCCFVQRASLDGFSAR